MIEPNGDIARGFAKGLFDLGICAGDIILVHASFKSLRAEMHTPETVIGGLLAAVGESGTLLMPALSYMQEPHEVHSTLETPSNIGAIPEYFRKREGTVRSVHPTHSICGIGSAVEELFKDHHLDNTPCGPHSPLNKMIDHGAKIVMLGCGLRPNTTMHALEGCAPPSYLFGENCIYTITDSKGKTYAKEYVRHGFDGWEQRYDRISLLPHQEEFIRRGKVLDAETYVIDTVWLKDVVVSKLQEDPLFFVEKI